VLSWKGHGIVLPNNATHYGFVREGDTIIETQVGSFRLQEGMYFAVPGSCTVSGDGDGFAASRFGYHGFFQIGGPVESTGRLRYIDGCSDSVLIAPVVEGDPCLNLLHIPPRTHQTSHTHPSVRVGMIAAGTGVCRTDEGDVELRPGVVFVIDPDGLHSFHTADDSLLVIAWHPDSDCGPTHQDHPMLNRTIIEGRSASPVRAAASWEGRNR
jgi:quercetin dioxygenase-like cupin family protein